MIEHGVQRIAGAEPPGQQPGITNRLSLVLTLAGMLPLMGCVSATTENRFSNWMRSLRPPTLSALVSDGAARTTEPTEPPAPPAANAASVAASSDADQAHSTLDAAPVLHWGDTAASTVSESLPPRRPTVPMQLTAHAAAPVSAPSAPSAAATPLATAVRSPFQRPPAQSLPITLTGTQLTRSQPQLVGRTRPLSVLQACTADFDKHVLSSDMPVLVDFYAEWCGPCKALAPTLDEVALESPHAKVVKVDIDDSPELAARYGVKSVPVLMVFKDGRVVAKQKGVVSKTQLRTMLDM